MGGRSRAWRRTNRPGSDGFNIVAASASFLPRPLILIRALRMQHHLQSASPFGRCWLAFSANTPRHIAQELRTVRVSDRLPDKVRDGLISKVAFEFIPGSDQTP